MHARHLALPFNVQIQGKKYYGVAYREPRSLDREELLQKSYEDARLRWFKTTGSKRAFFFIEDTSVIIHSLSRKKEYPGADVKYWMRTIDFEQLDKLLRKKGNNRAVTVRSDVILHLPAEFRTKHKIHDSFVRFVGNTAGTIAEKESAIETNLLYPWLDSKSFNKWFVPTGCTTAISALPIEIADRHDIRKDSIGAMLRFLAERNIFGDHPEGNASSVAKFLPRLFPPLLLVTGLPCAGKTLLGIHLSKQFGYYHLEASDFMKRAFYERHGLNSSLSIEAFAEKALLEAPDIVVTPVLEEIERSKAELIVVTGFRSPKEIEIFREKYRGPSEIKCWYIKANQKERYRRSGQRQRLDAAESFEVFQKRDELQNGMGLGEIGKLLRKSTFRNETTKQSYLKECTNFLGLKPRQFRWFDTEGIQQRPKSLEEAILVALASHGRESKMGLSTTEIAHKLNAMFVGSETSKNNVSRYFNFKPHPFYKSSGAKGVLKFVLSATGWSRAMRVVNAR